MFPSSSKYPWRLSLEVTGIGLFFLLIFNSFLCIYKLPEGKTLKPSPQVNPIVRLKKEDTATMCVVCNKAGDITNTVRWVCILTFFFDFSTWLVLFHIFCMHIKKEVLFKDTFILGK